MKTPETELLEHCLSEYVDVIATIFDNDREALSYEIYQRYLSNLNKYRARGLELNIYTYEIEIAQWLETLPQLGRHRSP